MEKSDQYPLPLPKYLQHEEMTQEFKDLLSSLPEKKWFLGHLHQYQGFWYMLNHLQGVVAAQKHFHAQDTDILIATNPKSGTTWLKAMGFALVNRVPYTITTTATQKVQHHPLLINNPHELVPYLEINLYVEKVLPGLGPRLLSTHLPYESLPESAKDSACKIVYLCRNPKDTFISLWLFIKRSMPIDWETNFSLEEACDKFCRGVCMFGPFWDHVLSYWKESLVRPQKVLFLKFEEMKKQPSVHLRKIADFLGCPISQEEEMEGVVDEIVKLCSFDSLSNLEVNKSGKLPSGVENTLFFRRGEIGDSTNYLTPEMVDRLDKITEERLHGSGLTF